MRQNFAQRGRPLRSAPPQQPKPASRAPHASTAKVDASELRNPSAIYAQAEALAARDTVPLPASAQRVSNVGAAGRGGYAASNASTSTAADNGSASSQTLARIADLAPYASGSSSTLFRTVLKTPQLTQLYMHGSFQSNAPDVLRQFAAELRFFRTVRRHRNIVAFVGSVEGVGMLLEYVEGETVWKYLGRGEKMSVRADWFNQILSGLCHIHSFGLGHNDLCSLNVVITLPPTPPGTQPPSASSKSAPKYIVKLLDFGRSTIEPRPAPVQSALAALKAQQQHQSLHSRGVPSWQEKEKERKEREKDLIFPGTRPFAAPEIMRAWTLSEAGSNNNTQGDDEEDEDSDLDNEGEDGSEMDTISNAMDEDFGSPMSPVEPPSAPLPLPLSTPAYMRDDDVVHQQQQALLAAQIDSRSARPNSLRNRMPLLSFSDSNPHAGPSSSSSVQQPSAPAPANDIPPNHSTRSRFAPVRGRTAPPPPAPSTHSHETASSQVYPSPTSSPSHSPHRFEPDIDEDGQMTFAHDDANDVVRSESHRFSRRHASTSRSRSRFGSGRSSIPSTPLHPYQAQAQAREEAKRRADAQLLAHKKAKAKARRMRAIEVLHSSDPFPPSPILGDTYSLGVLALCLERDVLVDVVPMRQMRERWDPLGLRMSDDGDGRDMVEIPEAQRGVAFFDGRFSTLSPAQLKSRGGKPGSLIGRYMRPIRQRERCAKEDELDVDAIRELEAQWAREERRAAGTTAMGGPGVVISGGLTPTPASVLTSTVPPNPKPNVHVSVGVPPPVALVREESPEMDFLMDDGGG